MQVKDLTTDELKALIRETVLETLEDFLEDLQDLRQAKAEEQSQPTLSLAEVKEQLNLQ